MNLTIRQEWYEVAEAVLDAEERAEFYGIVARYFFTGEAPDAQATGRTLLAMFMMIRPDLDKDRSEKERRAERKERLLALEREAAADSSQGAAENPPAEAPLARPKAERAAARPKAARFVKPRVEDVAAYCRERGYGVSAEQFVDYYESNGWRVGRNPMTNWKAAVTNWSRRQFGGSSKAGAAWCNEGAVPQYLIDLVG